MTDLAEFIRARLDEDEQVARAASTPGKPAGSLWLQDDFPMMEGRVVDEAGDVVVYDEGAPTYEQAEHIARHDPARVLREVEAKRRLLAMDVDPDEYNNDVVRGWCDAHSEVLRLLALPYADHPDFRAEWTPETVTPDG